MYVYFVQQGRTGPIKMGVAASPQDRLASLQVGNPNELRLICKTTVEGGYFAAGDLEQRLHRGFSLYRIRGEWFAPTKELLDTIAEIADPPRELIQSDPAPSALTEDERWEAMARRVRALVTGRPLAEEAS